MKELVRDLQTISRNLKALTQKTEKLIMALDNPEKKPLKTGARKGNAPKRAALKEQAAKDPGTPSATDTVLNIIRRSRNGVDTATLQKKTQYNSRKIWDIVHRAYKEGKIQKMGRGIYTKP